MATSLYKAQFALNICEKHDKKELIAYCKTCQEKICSSCIKEKHTSHDWEMIIDILREKKRSLPEECKEIRVKNLPRLEELLRSFDTKIEEEEACFEQNKCSLNSSRQSYINAINRIFDDRIDECRHKSESTVQMYKGNRDKLKQKTEYLDLVTTALDQDINTLPDHDILDMEKEMKGELEKALSYSADKYTCTTIFVAGQLDVHALGTMVGEIHSISVEEKYDIVKYSNVILSVKSTSDTNAWVSVGKDNYAKLIDREGNVMKTMKNPCTDLVILSSGEFVLTNKTKCNISILSKDEDTIRTIDTKPLQPTWISKTENDDILVTLRDDGDDYNLVPTSRRIVQRMTLTGEALHTYEFKKDNKTRLFTCQTKTVENKNTDICVVNGLSKYSGELVVLNKDGHIKFTYSGNGIKSEMFLPFDIECDSKGRIILTEGQHRAIHMLSAEGMYLCTLCQYEHLYPWVISIHGDNLWCGFLHGSLKILKYTN
ncbi:hypothetical protein FSP39_018608 [Pinctada imbricata]|uniref:B box-type domain-containing protein n=1 Tax=Pinctada imbricata TaxID=66713 RepID=A0AA88YRV2_PINIB|nr:hypothetical protein FSP39_018608 [Pinctada imbricata]